MSSRQAGWLALALLLLTMAICAGGAALLALTWSTRAQEIETSLATTLSLAAAPAFGLVGALIASRRPRNLVGWLLLAGGVHGALVAAAERYTVYGLIAEPGSLPAPRLIASLLSATWLFALTSIVLLLILFPSGKPASRRWQLATYITLASSLVAYVGLTLQPGPLDPPFDFIDNAAGISWLDGIEYAGGIAGLMPLFGLTLVSAIGAVMRFRKSQGDEREQFKWFVTAASLIPILLICHAVADGLAPSATETIEALFAIALALIAVAVGVAVLKYRLYDIDVLINRTLVYLPLTGILAGLYVALTGLSRTIFTSLTDAGSDAAIALSTLAVVAVLTPLKNQLQSLVDRYFKEQREPAKEVRRLAGQARAVLDVVDTQQFVQRFLTDITAALKAPGAALELRNGAMPQRVTSGDDWSGDAALSLPLQRNGYDLGTLALGRRPARPYDEAEREALQESADVLAHAIHLAHAAALREA
jgi:hypothetical protein